MADPSACGSGFVQCPGENAFLTCINGQCTPPPGFTLSGSLFVSTAPNPTVEVVAMNGTSDFAVDDTSVYYNDGAGNIDVVPSGGGTATTIVSNPSQPPFSVHLDASYVYWLWDGGGVSRAPKAGGSPQAVASAVQPTALAVDAQNVYWIEGTQTVNRAPSAGGTGVVLYTVCSGGKLDSLVQNFTSVAFRELGCGPIPHDQMLLVPKQGGGPVVVLAATMVGFNFWYLPQLLDLDDAYLYAGPPSTLASPPMLTATALPSTPTGNFLVYPVFCPSSGCGPLTHDASGNLFLYGEPWPVGMGPLPAQIMELGACPTNIPRTLYTTSPSWYPGRFGTDANYLYFSSAMGIARIPK
jgi:hypothetical protein